MNNYLIGNVTVIKTHLTEYGNYGTENIEPLIGSSTPRQIHMNDNAVTTSKKNISLNKLSFSLH